MKRWAALGLLVMLWLVPAKGKELGKLIPAEVLKVQMKGRMIALQTDTGSRGEGETLQAAINELNKTAPGTLLLETVQFCILSKNSGEILSDLQKEMRPSVRVCVTEDDIDAEKAAEYLRVHIPDCKMMDIGTLDEIPILYKIGGMYYLKNAR